MSTSLKLAKTALKYSYIRGSFLVYNGKSEITTDTNFQVTSFPTPRTILSESAHVRRFGVGKIVTIFDGIEVGSFGLLILQN